MGCSESDEGDLVEKGVTGRAATFTFYCFIHSLNMNGISAVFQY